VLPYVLTNFFHVQRAAGDLRAIPQATRLSFYIGAVAFITAVLWTVISTKEYPPDDMEAFRKAKAQKKRLGASAQEILSAIREMPETMRKLGPVQFFTWLGLFCMWLYFPIAVAHNVFGADDPHSSLYTDGVHWGGICFAVYSAVCFLFSFALPWLVKMIGRKYTHTLCLVCGALGLMSVVVIHNKWVLLLTMVGVGIAWASTLSMPYAVLAPSLPPAQTGVYMGIFNFFIVTPEILASLFFGWIMVHLLHNNRLYAIIAGGIFMLVAAALMQRVKDPRTLSVEDI
jgi:maltose/moltooligosaccharide transporter